MVQAPQRTALNAPALARLLAQLADTSVAESSQSLPDRLSQWLGWTDAIALSAALNGEPPGVAAGARAFGRDDATLCASVRSALTRTITRELAPAPTRRDARGAPPAAPADERADYAEYRQRYLSLQQAMETDIGQLRARLRVMLAAKTPTLARLAAVDAIMERSLGARERSLLASVPALLGARFERLRAADEALAAAQADGESAASTPGAWLDGFRKEMQSVLLAELEVRFQPVEGLLAALRAR
ncbi:DUF3348 domain-containing protein [Paraburkholderia adhaesiva]|uniref:DUF3348 domain-containing protein n=1 Tax=Paraburkholderia adhaesiva TaxID=2883244 RepID=UPI001F22F47A|nr:DUF3348 domain-containing protein [Paraburkholderia adhaesiva]